MVPQQSLISRPVDMEHFNNLRRVFPISAILGPRQCGKTTFARQFHADHYFDLENPRDVSRLSNAQLTLENLSGTIVIDEIQRKPDLFPLLRYLADTIDNQRYIILGSASRELIRQSSESLAGRIGYYTLGGFRLSDVPDLSRIWLRGGFPPAYKAATDSNAFTWIEQYITAYLERDIPQLGIGIPSQSLRRFWTMISHYHGQLLNFSELARSFGISDTTVRRYLDILEGTFMVKLLQPWHSNTGKRLVKAPKLYLMDSGIFHYFHQINNFETLLSHPKLGASFEGIVFDAVCRAVALSAESFSFYRTYNGAELDLFWQHDGRNWGVECKMADAPATTKSMKTVCKDLNLEHLWVVYPGKEEWQLDTAISVKSIYSIGREWNYGKTI